MFPAPLKGLTARYTLNSKTPNTALVCATCFAAATASSFAAATGAG